MTRIKYARMVAAVSLPLLLAALTTSVTGQAAARTGPQPPGPAAASQTPHKGGGGTGFGRFVYGHDTHHDVSPPLRSIAPITTAPGSPQIPDYNIPAKTWPYKKDPAVQTSARVAAMPSATENFAGVSAANVASLNSGSYFIPPDVEGAVGPNNYFQWVNIAFEIWNKSGASVYGPANGNTLWTHFNDSNGSDVCRTTNQGDPVVRYDAFNQRWVATQFAFAVSGGKPTSPFAECFAVSATSDPLGSWYRYEFAMTGPTNSNELNDYPKVGIWSDGYYFSVNWFNGNTFDGSGIFAIESAAMIKGQSARIVQQNIAGFGTLLPADVEGFTPPPAGEHEWFIARTGSSTVLNYWQLNPNFGGSATLAGPTGVTVDTYNLDTCSGSSLTCVAQPGTSQKLDTLGDRLMYRFTYRNLGLHEAFTVNQTVNAATVGNQAGVRWYEFYATSSTTLTMNQDGTYAPLTDTHERWMGSTAMDHNEDIAVGFTESDGSLATPLDPSDEFAGRLAGDAAGTLGQGETTLMAGGGVTSSGGNRWGDYSTMNIDPV
ncbi:MAG TPA: hypothetical protein VKU39_09065, partial [Streptosporangiaceae bacterium]|nr:hypothetical protein [Streptosporangiaceae bacterium]